MTEIKAKNHLQKQREVDWCFKKKLKEVAQHQAFGCRLKAFLRRHFSSRRENLKKSFYLKIIFFILSPK
ncbi:MAG: hypothetical protein IJ837_01225 [Clostridia bacterium]|nr:hypothetical protein [Clostridia bacterium]